MIAAILTVTILNTMLLILIAWTMARINGKSEESKIEISDNQKWTTTVT